MLFQFDPHNMPKWAVHLATAALFLAFAIIALIQGETFWAISVYLAYIVYSLIFAAYHFIKDRKSCQRQNPAVNKEKPEE